MTMTDPIADMLTRLRNANSAYHDDVAMPHSKIKSHIAEILQQEGFITGWKVEDAEVGKNLVLELKFGPNRERSIAGIKRISQAGSAGLREVHQPAEGARRPGRGDHLHVPRSPHRPAGRQEGRRWGSPRLRLVVGKRRKQLMSRIGKLPIPVPAGVDVTIDGRTVAVKGPKGSLTHTVAAPIEIAKGEDGVLHVTRPNDERQNKALHGLSRTLVANMITGVTAGYMQGARDQRCRLPRRRRRAPTWSSRSATATRSWSRPPRASPSRSSRPTKFYGRGHRQAEGRRGRRQHPQAAEARPVQGQGRQVRGRGHPPQGRKGW